MIFLCTLLSMIPLQVPWTYFLAGCLHRSCVQQRKFALFLEAPRGLCIVEKEGTSIVLET